MPVQEELLIQHSVLSEAFELHAQSGRRGETSSKAIAAAKSTAILDFLNYLVTSPDSS